MAEPMLLPEPPDGGFVLVGDPPWQRLLRRDDVATAEAQRDGLWPDLPADARWWLAGNDSIQPLCWRQVLAPDHHVPGVTPEPTVVQLFTQEQLDAAVREGGYEQVGGHRIALHSGLCVAHGERYELPHELDRLRQREGGQGGSDG